MDVKIKPLEMKHISKKEKQKIDIGPTGVQKPIEEDWPLNEPPYAHDQ